MDTKKKILLFLSMVSAFLAKGQNYEKSWWHPKDSLNGYYVNIVPQSRKIQGVLVLLNSFGSMPEDVFSDTKLQGLAYANDILTIGIRIGEKLYADQSVVDRLNGIFKDVKSRFTVDSRRFFIGGLGYGGTVALRYTELCKEKQSSFPIDPAGVFAIDPVVDVIGSWQNCERYILKNLPYGRADESKFILDLMRRENGELKENFEKYWQLSPFYKDSSAPGNEQFLAGIPVRLYYDADIGWYIRNRNKSLYDTDLPDASEMINRLSIRGNSKAEFITSQKPSYKNNGQRSPFTWSVADEMELISWMKKELHFFPEYINKPYTYEAPGNWNTELISFPIDFAPSIPYQGFEDLRFSPGWGKINSDEIWAYTLLWWLDKKYNFDAGTFKRDLEEYFTGLTKRRASADKLEGARPAVVQVQKQKTLLGDQATYSASIDIFDAQVTHHPNILFAKIHVKACEDRSVIFLEVAGKNFSEPVWQTMDKINDGFRCLK